MTEHTNEQDNGNDQQEAKLDFPNLHVFMPPGLGIHLLRSLEPRDIDADTLERHNTFANNMQELFAGLQDGTIEAAVVLVKRRIDQPSETDPAVMERGFSLDGGVVGGQEECTALIMHLTETVQTAAKPEYPQPPEGMSEADRCPGCGGFHDGDEELGSGEGMKLAPGSDAIH